jgi:4-oxalmesaconate hydratase
VYEKMVELDVPAMVHVSASCNPNFHATGAHYINADTTAFMQFLTADLFRDFPTLRFIIPHGGGAVPYHWGRYRGLAQDLKRPPLAELIRDHVFFDTCVYHLPGVDPETGHYFDDTKRYIDRVTSLGEADRTKIFEGTARKVYPRINKSPAVADGRVLPRAAGTAAAAAGSSPDR